MRRGFWKELDTTFKASIEMVGGTYPPDLMADEIEHRKALHKEVRTALKMWENQTKATMRAIETKEALDKAACFDPSPAEIKGMRADEAKRAKKAAR